MQGFRALPLLLALLIASSAQAAAPDFPKLSGRVVDAAEVLPADVEVSLDAKLAALETATGKQVVVATVPDLQGYDIQDYGYQLGRAWGIGDAKADDGVVLLVAPKERKVRIEVGYGLEPVLTDALTSLIIQRQILPKFRDGDLPAGVEAGADAIVQQLGLPADQAQAIAQQAAEQPRERSRDRDGPGFGAVVWFIIILFWIIASASRRGRRSGLGGVCWFILGSMLNSGGGRGGGGGWSGGGGGGGFSGGGGSFGGGGSSGSW